MKIAGIGELLWDCLPAGRQIGGAPLNFAYQASRFGADGYIVSAVGRDADGDELLEGIDGMRIDTSFVRRNTLPTSRVEVELDSRGVPTYIICENVAWDNFEVDAALLELAAELDAVCWGSLAQRSDTSRRNILRFIDNVRPECLKVFDINIRQSYYSKEIVEDSLRRADVLKLNEDELPILQEMFALDGDSRAQLEALVSLFDLRYAVYTRGTEGSAILCRTGEYTFVPTPKVDVADTVGAGDAFTASAVAGMLKGEPQIDFHRRSVDVAAYVCTQKGATPRLPEKFVK